MTDELTIELVRRISELEKKVDYLHTVEKNVFSTIAVGELGADSDGWYQYGEVPNDSTGTWDEITVTFTAEAYEGGYFKVKVAGRLDTFGDCYCEYVYSYATATGSAPATAFTQILGVGATLSLSGSTSIPADGGGAFSVVIDVSAPLRKNTGGTDSNIIIESTKDDITISHD